MPNNRIVTSLEQVADAMISLIQKNASARSVFVADTVSGSNIILVDNTFHFNDSENIALFDMIDGHVEYHTILKIDSTNQIRTVSPIQSDFLVSNQATIQKALGNALLPENFVLFGDRQVIPNPEITIVVDPLNVGSMEWMYLRAGLNFQHNLAIMIYVKMDSHDTAIRVCQKYGDYIMQLLLNNIHLDVVNDEFFLPVDANIGDQEIQVPSINGWYVDVPANRYELQDNYNAETEFSVVSVLDTPPRVRLNRPISNTYRVSDKAKIRRRVRYIWNSMLTDVEYGFIQKGSEMYKACKLTWWGKEIAEIMVPQTTAGGIG